MEIKNNNLFVYVLDSFVYDKEHSPSVKDFFNKKYSDYLENFKQDCDDLSESQNGYYSTESMNDGSYKTTFYTTDGSSDDFYGVLTGVVVFKVECMYDKNIVNFIDE